MTDGDLQIARSLAAAGIPVLVAYPDPEGKTPSGRATGYALRTGWQATTPNPDYVSAWKPGLALVAVMGCGLDLVDIDPRNGGDAKALTGIVPDVIGMARSPSGGYHLFVRSMGVRSRDGVLPGIDVKAGDPDGQGRGFAFIAPTMRPSKVTGKLAAYEWVNLPDVAKLNGVTGAGSALADLVRGAHGSRKTLAAAGFAQPDQIERKHAGPIPYGEHHSQLVSYAGWLRTKAIPLRPEAETLMLRRLTDVVQPSGAARPVYTQEEALAELYDVYDRYDAGDAAAETPQSSPQIPDTLLARLLHGDAILDVPPVPDAVWGDGEEILWAAGQSLVIAGPDGVGKTTLAGNLIRARLGIGGGLVLGLPVKPGDRNVLVLLMDRPLQAMAALARLFTENDRPLLNARLRIWRGPPPQDLARNTTMLAELCILADADTCLIDSLKDAALKLTDDETGSGWNRSRQIAIEAGTQLTELHHPRKGQDGNRKPSKLDDLYGSRWISAGAGSVVSLWGQAGDPIVELTHLKPPVEALGPWRVTIDNTTGEIARDKPINLVEQVYGRGSNGITAEQAATLLYGADKPTRAEIGKATRKLDKLYTDGSLLRQNAPPGRGNQTIWLPAARQVPVTFSPAAPSGSVTFPESHGESHAKSRRRSESHAALEEPEKVTPPAPPLYIGGPERDFWPPGSAGAEANP
jgi:replicative DNA helicase